VDAVVALLQPRATIHALPGFAPHLPRHMRAWFLATVQALKEGSA